MSIPPPDWVRFFFVDDDELRGQLEQLIAAAGDDDLRRPLRDRRRDPNPIDLVLDCETPLDGCVVRYPPFGAARIEATEFPIDHPSLRSELKPLFDYRPCARRSPGR